MSVISRSSVEYLTSITKRVTATASNTVDDPAGISRAICVNGSGDVAMILAGESTAMTETLTAGVVYPYAVKRVLVTGTDATGIRLLY